MSSARSCLDFLRHHGHQTVSILDQIRRGDPRTGLDFKTKSPLQIVGDHIISSRSWYLIPHLAVSSYHKYSDSYGRTFLMHIILERQYPYAYYMIGAGAALNTWDSNGFTPIHYAAGVDLNLFRALLRAGADIEAQALEGESVAHVAAKTGNVPLLQFLAKKKVNLTRVDNSRKTPPIMSAITYGKLEAVQFLISYHPSDFRGPSGRNLATFALTKNQIKIYQYLISIGIEPHLGIYKIPPIIPCMKGGCDELLDQVGTPLIDPLVGYTCVCTGTSHDYQKDTCPTLLNGFIKDMVSVQLLLSRGIGYTYT